MSRFFKSPKFLAAFAFAVAALGAANVAEARPDVYLSIGFQSGPTWAEPAPVYVQPHPGYVQPVPTYGRPPVYVAPPVVFERPYWSGHDARDEWRRERAWREWRRHEWREHFGHRDDDRDHRGWHHGDRD